MDIQQFEGRKRDHIQHALNPAHQAIGLSGLDQIHLAHEALPEFDFQDVRLNSVCLGRPAATPFYVAGMTAGHPDAPQLNRTLAVACQERGWAMGVGSQRRDLETGEHGTLDLWKEIRREAPDLTLFANVGITQLPGVSLDAIRRLVESLRAQALAVHQNPLQEVMQPEGTPYFKDAFSALKKLCASADFPIVLKETGCGFSESTLKRIADIGVAAVDVSGLGGTHWGRLEGARSQAGSIHAAAAATFANWGEGTVDSVRAARRVLPKTEVWASGGVRSGLDAAKLIAIGADRVGYAKPALEAALAGPEALRRWMEIQEYELRVALFCTGSEDLKKLQEGYQWKANGI